MRSSWNHVWAAALVLGLLVAPAFADAAATDGAAVEAQTEGAAVAETVEVTFAGMKIAVDPKTGHLRPPTKRESKRLERKMKRMFRHVLRHHESEAFAAASSGNPMSRVLGQEHLNFEVLRIDAEGDVAGHCANGVEAAAELLNAPVDLTPAREEM